MSGESAFNFSLIIIGVIGFSMYFQRHNDTLHSVDSDKHTHEYGHTHTPGQTSFTTQINNPINGIRGWY